MTVSERRFGSSADVVYDALIDAKGYPEWLVGAKVVRVVDPAWPAPGSSFQHRVGVGPLEVADSTTVADIGPGRRLHLVVRARPFLEADVHFEVLADPGSGAARGAGCTVRMDEQPRGRFRLAAPILAPLVKLRNDKSLERLARRLDGR